VELVQKFTKHCLLKPEVFQNVKSICNCRVPFVTFYHVPSDFICDVSFKSGLGTYNTKLIKYVTPLNIWTEIWLYFFYSILLQILFVIKHYSEVAGLCYCEELGYPKWFKRQELVHQLCLDMAGTVLFDDGKSDSIVGRTQAKCYSS